MKFVKSQIDHHFDPHGPWTPGMLLGQKRASMRDRGAASALTLADALDNLGLEPTEEGQWRFDKEVNSAFVPSWTTSTSAHDNSGSPELSSPELEGLREAAKLQRQRELISFSKPTTTYYGPCGLNPEEYYRAGQWKCSGQRA